MQTNNLNSQIVVLSQGDLANIIKNATEAGFTQAMSMAQNTVNNVGGEILEVFDKKECSKVSGYSVNTINKMICEKKIPHYKLNAKVLFRRDEILDWMLKNRVQTSSEYIAKKEVELSKRAKA